MLIHILIGLLGMAWCTSLEPAGESHQFPDIRLFDELPVDVQNLILRDVDCIDFVQMFPIVSTRWYSYVSNGLLPFLNSKQIANCEPAFKLLYKHLVVNHPLTGSLQPKEAWVKFLENAHWEAAPTAPFNLPLTVYRESLLFSKAFFALMRRHPSFSLFSMLGWMVNKYTMIGYMGFLLLACLRK